jgi:hypothetical protein
VLRFESDRKRTGPLLTPDDERDLVRLGCRGGCRIGGVGARLGEFVHRIVIVLGVGLLFVVLGTSFE